MPWRLNQRRRRRLDVDRRSVGDAHGRKIGCDAAVRHVVGQVAWSHRGATRAINTKRGQKKDSVASFPCIATSRSSHASSCIETIERTLGDRPRRSSIPTPGRTHLYLADPERFNLNLMNVAGVALAPAPEVVPSGGTADGPASKERS